MKRKLKDLRKGDFILMHHKKFLTGEITKTEPFRIESIEFEPREEKVWDMQLVNSAGREKHYSFLDWNEEVATANGFSNEFESDKCPCCGRMG